MKLNYLSFVRKLIFFTLAVAVVATGAAYLLPATYVTPTLPFLVVFFFAATMLVHYLLFQVARKRAASFINLFMLLTFGKLIFFLSIVMAYALLRGEDAAQFIVAFFILYLFFTVFEVIQSLSLSKALYLHRQKQEEEDRNNS